MKAANQGKLHEAKDIASEVTRLLEGDCLEETIHFAPEPGARFTYANCTARLNDRKPFDKVKNRDIFRRCAADWIRKIGSGCPLVIAQLPEHGIAPVLRPFRFPEKRATLLVRGRDYLVEDVSAELSFGRRLDKICGNLCREKRLRLRLPKYC